MNLVIITNACILVLLYFVLYPFFFLMDYGYGIVFIVVSRPLKSYGDRCDVVEMKLGRGNMFMTMDNIGNIRVYTLTSGKLNSHNHT